MKPIINAHSNNPSDVPAITATLVTDDAARLRCLPRVAGSRCVLLESAIYEMLERMSGDYRGGYWEYFTLSNGGFFMAPPAGQTFRLCCDNMFEGEVSARTAGVIASAMAYSHLSFRTDGRCFAKAYYLLTEFIYQQEDAAAIHAALD